MIGYSFDEAFTAINSFPSKTPLAAYLKFCYVATSFSSIAKHFLIYLFISSVIRWLGRRMLFNFHISVNFPNFIFEIDF